MAVRLASVNGVNLLHASRNNQQNLLALRQDDHRFVEAIQESPAFEAEMSASCDLQFELRHIILSNARKIARLLVEEDRALLDIPLPVSIMNLAPTHLDLFSWSENPSRRLVAAAHIFTVPTTLIRLMDDPIQQIRETARLTLRESVDMDYTTTPYPGLEKFHAEAQEAIRTTDSKIVWRPE